MEFADFIRTPKVEEAFLEGSCIPKMMGSACLTGHHLILYSHGGDNAEHWILHRNVDTIEKRLGNDKCQIVLKCKDFETYQLTVINQEDAQNIANSIENLSTLDNISLQYPFFYKPLEDLSEPKLGSVEEDFLMVSNVSDQWRISDINKNFEVCPTYPQRIIVPLSITDQMIYKSSDFRRGGRFPVLSYCHHNGRVVMRSSEPLIGSSNRRCKEDEKLINVVLGKTHRGYILDSRSQQIAAQARSKGGGTETEFNYPQWRKIHHNLSRTSTVHESICKLVEVSRDKNCSVEKWRSRVESCNWLHHLKQLLTAACLVAQCLDKDGASMLVHCSDGFDNSIQITSLTQIILNSECRTIRGFLNLIEKEWILFGHPFKERCSKSAYSVGKARDEGPTFLLFLDCVHQLMHQYPLSFEFDGSLLCELARHCYASKFGNFLCNNELERFTSRVRSKTTSLWAHLLSEDGFTDYVNPVYRQNKETIWPSVAPQSLVLWSELFTPHVDPNSDVRRGLRSNKLYLHHLRSVISQLTQEVDELEAQEKMKSSEGEPRRLSAEL